MASKPAATTPDNHPRCFACGRATDGLALAFSSTADGVTAEFACDPCYRSYDDCLHGGIVATLLDAAMTHALFARGTTAVTARLTIQYRRPVALSVPAQITGRVTESRNPLYHVVATVEQDGRRCAEAKAVFMDRTAPREGHGVEASAKPAEGRCSV